MSDNIDNLCFIIANIVYKYIAIDDYLNLTETSKYIHYYLGMKYNKEIYNLILNSNVKLDESGKPYIKYRGVDILHGSHNVGMSTIKYNKGKLYQSVIYDTNNNMTSIYDNNMLIKIKYKDGKILISYRNCEKLNSAFSFVWILDDGLIPLKYVSKIKNRHIKHVVDYNNVYKTTAINQFGDKLAMITPYNVIIQMHAIYEVEDAVYNILQQFGFNKNTIVNNIVGRGHYCRYDRFGNLAYEYIHCNDVKTCKKNKNIVVSNEYYTNDEYERTDYKRNVSRYTDRNVIHVKCSNKQYDYKHYLRPSHVKYTEYIHNGLAYVCRQHDVGISYWKTSPGIYYRMARSDYTEYIDVVYPTFV